jgi:hypothetical protein
MAIPVWDNPQISGGAKASILLVYREATEGTMQGDELPHHVAAGVGPQHALRLNIPPARARQHHGRL